MWVSYLLSTERTLIDCKLRNAPNAWKLSASKPHVPSLVWRSRHVDSLPDMSYCPAECGETLLFGALTISPCADLVVGQDFDVAWYGPHAGKLCLACQGWYISLNWKKQNLSIDSNFFGNGNGNCTSWLDAKGLLYVRSWGSLETNFSKHLFCLRTYFPSKYIVPTSMKFEISAKVHRDVSPRWSEWHLPDILYIAELLATPSTSCYTL
jgi:hypothetical protein